MDGGTRVWKREYQTASMVFYKNEQSLALQGMIHWGTPDFFRHIQQKINACVGIILKEDNGYLDPAALIELDDASFNMYCCDLDRKTDKVREVMKSLLGFDYQWDVLKYPGPPQSLCADVSWHEEAAFDRYMNITLQAGEGGHHYGDGDTAWDLLLACPEAGRVLLNGVMHRCFRLLDRTSGMKAKEEMLNLFAEWSEGYRFRNSTKVWGLFHDLVCHFGSDTDEMEPEHKAFVFDKRESRVLKLVERIELLDYVSEMLIPYGAGHFESLRSGLKAMGWRPRGPMVWTTALTFAPTTPIAMLKALNALTRA